MMRNPLFNELLGLRGTVDQLFRESPFGDAFGTLWSRAESSGGSVARPMPLDIYSNNEEVVILAVVPGMQPDDLDLTVQKNTVTISGTVRSEWGSGENSGVTWYVRELADGTYRRSVTLPFPVDAERTEANFENGILRIVLPKTEAAKPRKISIQSGRQEQAIEAGGGENKSRSTS
jgi:HSP20 family protein